MRARRLLAAAAAGAVLAGCGLPTSGRTTSVPTGSLPGLRAAPTPTAAAPAAFTSTVDVWLVGPDGLLVPRFRPAPAGPPAEAARVALDALRAGPDEAERAAGLSSEVAAGADVDVVALEDRTVSHEIRFAAPPPAERLPTAVGQVVLTVTSVPGVNRVLLVDGGTAVSAPLPDGELTERPLTAADYASLTRP